GVKKYLVQGSINFDEISDGLYGCVIGKKLLNTLGANLKDTVFVFGLQGH
ncbi:MAG TPA: hypothetical protein DCQ28_06180, partial [Bacteroidetes bacterium]|nr:hypothetical protein [Bacteroidota bacterium]